ncbi:MAG: hypothetical protein OXC06_14170 [Acidimicrobiaceae bacterium]|nr:hypothetical protein [Acidimicrobiaceae bacterium]
MRRQLSFCVVADGGTDRVLVPIIQWAIHKLDPDVEILEPAFSKRKSSVADFLRAYRPEAMLTFLHRDAENRSLYERLQEFPQGTVNDIVPVVPIRMSEAWILFDGSAIARAADRPSYHVTVPEIAELERLADPKSRLEELLLEAAGSPTGRRLKMFKRSIVDRRVSVASLIADFSPLMALSAFTQFQQTLAEKYPFRHILEP